LPIEKQVDKKLGSKKREMDALAIRQTCRDYATRFIDVQREEFRRLLVGGAWDRPYTTMTPSYEGRIARTFGDFYRKDLVTPALKSVRWCFTDQTALAEAELEYEERTDTAIWVRMPFESAEKVRAAFGNPKLLSPYDRSEVFAVIWTTTPWTIPSNLAIAVHPKETYALWAVGGRLLVVAKVLLPAVSKVLGDPPGTAVVGEVPGQALVGLRYRHPLGAEMRGELTPEEASRSFRIVL